MILWCNLSAKCVNLKQEVFLKNPFLILLVILGGMLPNLASGASQPVYCGEWGSHGTGPGQFNYPCGIAVDANGDVYVADTYNCRIQKFTSSGVYLTEWGSPVGDWPGFEEPRAVAIDISGNVLVGDSYYLTKFTSNGEYISRLGGPGQLGGVSGIAVEASGRVYVADYPNNQIQVFTASGIYVTQWGSSGTG